MLISNFKTYKYFLCYRSYIRLDFHTQVAKLPSSAMFIDLLLAQFTIVTSNFPGSFEPTSRSKDCQEGAAMNTDTTLGAVSVSFEG